MAASAVKSSEGVHEVKAAEPLSASRRDGRSIWAGFVRKARLFGVAVPAVPVLLGLTPAAIAGRVQTIPSTSSVLPGPMQNIAMSIVLDQSGVKVQPGSQYKFTITARHEKGKYVFTEPYNMIRGNMEFSDTPYAERVLLYSEIGEKVKIACGQEFTVTLRVVHDGKLVARSELHSRRPWGTEPRIVVSGGSRQKVGGSVTVTVTTPGLEEDLPYYPHETTTPTFKQYTVPQSYLTPTLPDLSLSVDGVPVASNSGNIDPGNITYTLHLDKPGTYKLTAVNGVVPIAMPIKNSSGTITGYNVVNDPTSNIPTDPRNAETTILKVMPARRK